MAIDPAATPLQRGLSASEALLEEAETRGFVPSAALVRQAVEAGVARALDRSGAHPDDRVGRVARVETRDPRAGTVNQSWVAVGQPQVAEWDAESAVRMGYLANVYVYRCIQVAAVAVGGLPFRAGPDPDKPGQWRKDAPLARLLGPATPQAPGGPNPDTSSRRFWAFTVASLLATGRFAHEIETDGPKGPVLNLWPLMPSLFRPVPSDRGSRWFSGYRYGTGSKETSLDVDHAWYEWRPSLTDFRQPESPLQAARLEVSTAVLLDRYAYAFLQNDARPAAVIVTQAFADPEERNAWRAQFLSEHRGVDNAGRVVFAEVEDDGDTPTPVQHSVEVQTLGLSQEAMQFIAQMEQMIKGICAALGTPRSKLSNSNESTFSNAEQDDVNWWRDTMKPLLEELADSVNLRLAPRVGPDVGWFDISRVPQLTTSKVLSLKNPQALIDGGTLTRDDLRTEIDVAPLPDGMGAVPTVVSGGQVIPLADALNPPEPPPPAPIIVAPPAPPALPPGAPTPPVPPAPAADTSPVPVPAPGGARGRRRVERRSDDPERRARARFERRRKEYRAVDAAVRRLERSTEKRVAGFFARQEKQVLRRLHGQRRRLVQSQRRTGEVRVDPGDLFDEATWNDDLAELFQGVYTSVVDVAGTRVTERVADILDATGIQMPDVDDVPGMVDLVEGRAQQIAGLVNQATYDAIREAMVEGAENGEGIPDLAKRIQGVFASSSRRATTIARTEVISSYNGATTLYGQALGAEVVGGQEWIATLDDRVRPDHADADGQVVAIDEPFDVGGESLQYPGDPDGSPENVINCRCTVGLITADEWTADEGDRAVFHALRARTRARRGQTLLMALEVARRSQR